MGDDSTSAGVEAIDIPGQAATHRLRKQRFVMSQPLSDSPVVAWMEGLFIEPAHFQWMEAGLESRLHAVRSAGLVAPWGIGVIRTWWDGTAIGIELLDAVMPSGIRIVVPSVDRVTTLNVAIDELDEDDLLRIDLAIPRRNAHGVLPEGSIVFDEVKAADALAEHPRPVPIPVVRLGCRLVPAGQAPAGWETMPVARLRRPNAYRDQLELDPDFIPPLIRIGGSGVLVGRFEQLHRRCRQAAIGIADDLKDKRLSGVGTEDVTVEALLRLASLNRCIGTLQPLVGRDEPHPFEIHRTLSAVLAELSFHGADRVVPEAPAYDHLRFAEQFAWFIERIDAMVTTRFQPLYDPVELTTDDGWRWSCPVDERWSRGSTLLLALETGEEDAASVARWLRDAKVYGDQDVAVPQYALNGLRVAPRERELTGLPTGFVFAELDVAGSEEPRRRGLRESSEVVVETPECLLKHRLVFFTERSRS